VSEEQSAGPIVVTGAGGFIGGALVQRLAGSGAQVRAVLRRPAALPPGAEARLAGDLDAAAPWPALLAGARAVVHLASRAHAPAQGAGWIEAEAATAAALARAAAAAGIGRIVLLSSIKVLGEATPDRPFRADQRPAPVEAYGHAKARGEEAMRAEAGAILAVIRPPLVYGPGVKGNFRALLRLADRGVPLPLAGIDNRRSLVFLDNLLDLIELALAHPAAAGGSFLLRDDEEVSTPELLRRLASNLGRPARLFPCPRALLHVAGTLTGRRGAVERLLSSLRIDDGATRERLGWRPRVALADGLAATCRWYVAEGR
jgi:UDP-N-acetyl-alpha-D-quinovosamine dehydrogenase